MTRTSFAFITGKNCVKGNFLLLLLGLLLAGPSSNVLAQDTNAVAHATLSLAAPLASSHEPELRQTHAALLQRLQELDELAKQETLVQNQEPQTGETSTVANTTESSSPSSQQAEPVPDSTPAAASIGATVLSSTLMRTFETAVNAMKEPPAQNQPPSKNQAEESAPEVAKFVEEKIESLDRMIELMEQMKKLQAVQSAYQKRLTDLQKKVDERDRQASKITAER